MSKRWERWLALALGVVGAGVVGYLTQTTGGQVPSRTAPATTPTASTSTSGIASSALRHTGNPPQVSAFTIKTLSGATITVPGAPVTVMYFMSAQCGSCVAGEQQLATLVPNLPSTVRFVSVDVTPQTDSPTTVMTMAQSVGAQWPQAFASNAMLEAYHVTQLDQVAVVNSHGQILYNGALPSNTQLQQLIGQAVKG